MTTASIWLSVRARDVWSVAREVAGERGRAGFRQARAQRLLKQLFNAFPEDAEEHQSCDHGGYPDDDWRCQRCGGGFTPEHQNALRMKIQDIREDQPA